MGVRADLEFDRPHGLQTEVSGLREWLGVTSWQEEYDRDGHNSVTLTSLDTEKTVVGEYGGMTLDFRSGWGVGSEEAGDRRVLLDLLRCSTRSADPVDWDVHMAPPQGVRDLLVISRWRNESCVPVRALLGGRLADHHGR